MLLVGLARHYLISWLDTRPKPISRAALREQRALMRGQLLRAKGKHLPRQEYEARREWLMEAFTEKKYLQSKPDGAGKAATPNPLDPAAMDGMIGMIKKQAVSFVPQSILMGWINLFFSGFVLSAWQNHSWPYWRLSFLTYWYLLHVNSTPSFSTHHPIQIDDAERHRYVRHGRDLGIVPIVVLPKSFRPEYSLWIDSWWR